MYFSARSASWAPLLFQQITRCHSVFSCFSPPCPVHCRLVAKDRVATREPLLVLRTSGSAPKFPISMTLLRLRLTTDLQTLGGSGPRATTVYDPQVILSIKDTPLVLKFCRPPLGRNGSPQHHRVLDWPTVVPRPSRASHLACASAGRPYTGSAVAGSAMVRPVPSRSKRARSRVATGGRLSSGTGAVPIQRATCSA